MIPYYKNILVSFAADGTVVYRKCTRLSFSGQARIANQIGIVNQRIMAIQTSVAQSNDYMFDTQQDTKSTLRQVTEVLVPNVQDLCDISRKIWFVIKLSHL